MSITLQPVTGENWNALIKLKVRDDQSKFVASNLYSIAEAQFGYKYEGHWDLHTFGIFTDDIPVGFLMYGYNFAHPRIQAYTFRLMVDEKYQGNGYGRLGMEKMLRIFSEDERIKSVGISYKPENEVARRLYAILGFVEPGDLIESEVLAILNLR